MTHWNAATVAPRLRAGGLRLSLRIPVCVAGALALSLLALGCERTSASGDAGVKEEASLSDLERPPLTATFETPEALASAFLEALHEKDRDALLAFALGESEFRAYVWPELPASATWPFEYGWNDLRQKSLSSLTRTYHDFGGRRLELVAIRFDGETSDYGSYRVHRDARVQVLDEEGETRWIDLFGSVMEHDGRFKLFSYVTD